MNYRVLKRLINPVIAVILLLILSPLMLLISILIYIENDGSVLFKQRRPGLNNRIFEIYKFKTMKDTKDADGILLPDTVRTTTIGKLLRLTSLDELPQLYNVALGQMAFIGPRPLLEEYLDLYSNYHKKRHNVLPGMTGWAQINGRNTISWSQKFDLDVFYVENESFVLDLKIVLMTIKKVLLKKDINQNKDNTMTKFMGYDE